VGYGHGGIAHGGGVQPQGCLAVVVAKEEQTKVRGHWELQS